MVQMVTFRLKQPSQTFFQKGLGSDWVDLEL